MTIDNRDVKETPSQVLDALRGHGSSEETLMQVQDTVDRTEVNRIKARVRRGMALVDRVKRHGDLYIVAGNGGNYTVSLDNVNGETCECVDWKQHSFGHTCKHIVAVTIANAKR